MNALHAIRQSDLRADGKRRRKYEIEEQKEKPGGVWMAASFMVVGMGLALKNLLFGNLGLAKEKGREPEPQSEPEPAAPLADQPSEESGPKLRLIENTQRARAEAREEDEVEPLVEGEDVNRRGTGGVAESRFDAAPLEDFDIGVRFHAPPPFRARDREPGSNVIPLPLPGTPMPQMGGKGASGGGRRDRDWDQDDDDDDEDDDRTEREPNRRPVLSSPVALSDIYVNQTLLIGLTELLSGASDPDGDSLSVRDLVASSGTLVDHQDGRWSFAPDPHDDSAVTFSYSISDGEALVAQTATLDLLPIPGVDLVGGEGDDTLIGTAGDDRIEGGEGNDRIVGREGRDVLDGGEGDDQIVGGLGDDLIRGGEGNDALFGGAGDDLIFGGEGDDLISGDGGDDTLRGGEGADTLHGGAGVDLVFGDEGDDRIVASVGDGDDIYLGGAGADTYDLSATSAAAVVDLDAGTASSAETGLDALSGIENVIGGQGDDVIIAGAEPGVFSGGGGGDVFVFVERTKSGQGGDWKYRIEDFHTGDRIDVSDMDGDNHTDGWQRINLLRGADDFDDIAQAIVTYEDREEGSVTRLRINFERGGDGDETDFEIEIVGRHDLDEDNFITIV